MKLQFALLLLLGIVGTGWTQTLKCYDCEANDDECADPVKFVAPDKNCNNDTDRLSKDVNATSLCLSAHIIIKGDASRTGVYRGCQAKPLDVEDFCDFFKEKMMNDTVFVKSCEHCNSSRCNNVTFNSSGEKNSSSLIQTVFSLLIISSVFILIL